MRISYWSSDVCSSDLKTPEFIQQRCAIIADFLHQHGAKALVVACNTATVAGVADLRRDYPHWPIVGMEPAVKPAAAATRSGIVGVLATTGTLQSPKFAGFLDRFAPEVQVFTQPCPGLVDPHGLVSGGGGGLPKG